MKKCPKCGFTAETQPNIEMMFGYRKINGKQIPQSYCRECRGGKPAAAKEVNPIPYIAVDNPLPVSKAIITPVEVLKDAKVWDLKAILASTIRRMEAELFKAYGKKDAPDSSPLAAELRAAENLFQLLCQKKFVAFGPELPSDVHEISDSWTICYECNNKFVKDPKAAGWKNSGWSGHFDKDWRCHACWQEDLDHCNIEYNKTGCVLKLGYNDEYSLKRKFTKTEVEKRIKTLDKKSLEYKFWNEEGRMKSIGCKDSSRLLGSSVNKKYLELFRELLGFKPFPPLPETLKI